MIYALIGANSFLAQEILNQLASPSIQFLQVYHYRQHRLHPDFPRLTITKFLKQKPRVDTLFLIAAVIDFSESPRAISLLFDTNVRLTRQLSENHPNAQMLYASSVSVYGKANSLKNEFTLPQPQGSYAISKLWAEQLVQKHPGGGGVVRISSMFGAGMQNTTFIPLLLARALSVSKIVIFGDGSRYQNYIHVRSVAAIFCKAIGLQLAHPLLAVDSKSYTNLEVAKYIQQIFPNIVIQLSGVDHSHDMHYDNTQTLKNINIPNQPSQFAKQLRNMAIWMKKQYSLPELEAMWDKGY